MLDYSTYEHYQAIKYIPEDENELREYLERENFEKKLSDYYSDSSGSAFTYAFARAGLVCAIIIILTDIPEMDFPRWILFVFAIIMYIIIFLIMMKQKEKSLNKEKNAIRDFCASKLRHNIHFYE